MVTQQLAWLTWRDRGLAWLRRHPRLADAALVAVLFWLCGPPLNGIGGGPQARSLALLLAMLTPLIWRRRAPLAVFAVICVIALAQLLVSAQITSDVAVLVAFYTVAARESWRVILAAAAVLEIGAVPVALRNAPDGHGVVWIWASLSGMVAAAGMAGWYARTRRAHLAGLAEHAGQLERERIAREMHDIVAHNIAVMIALADGAAYTAADSPVQAATLMGEISATGRSALTEMRRLLGVLRQPAGLPLSPQPSLADLDDLLGTFRAAGLPVRMTVTGQASDLPPSAQLTVYRMIQEALTNTLKHAPGATALVRLACRPDAVELEVTDDGAPVARPGSGHGIAGMRERAAVFGADVSAGPGPGGGWQVHTVLPLSPARRATAPGAL